MATRKKRSTAGIKKACRKVTRPTGVKLDGSLKKGYRYAKGGRVVKAKATK